MTSFMNRRDLLAAPAWTAALADRWMKNAFSCALVAVGALTYSGHAEAATLTTIQTIEGIPFAFSRTNFPILEDVDGTSGKVSRSERQRGSIEGQFQGFDPSLGTLQKVDINVSIRGRIELVIRSSSIDTLFGGGGTRDVVANLEFFSAQSFNGAAPSGLSRLFSTAYTVESGSDGGGGTVTAGDPTFILNFLGGASVGQSFDRGTGDLSLFESAGYLPYLLNPGTFFQVSAECTPFFLNPVTGCDANARFRIEGNFDIRLNYTYDDLQDPSPVVVPLPATALLLVGALAAFGRFGARRRR